MCYKYFLRVFSVVRCDVPISMLMEKNHHGPNFQCILLRLVMFVWMLQSCTTVRLSKASHNHPEETNWMEKREGWVYREGTSTIYPTVLKITSQAKKKSLSKAKSLFKTAPPRYQSEGKNLRLEHAQRTEQKRTRSALHNNIQSDLNAWCKPMCYGVA